jgi:hypothetical protein
VASRLVSTNGKQRRARRYFDEKGYMKPEGIPLLDTEGLTLLNTEERPLRGENSALSGTEERPLLDTERPLSRGYSSPRYRGETSRSLLEAILFFWSTAGITTEEIQRRDH